MSNWFDNIRIYHLLIDRFNGGWQVPPKSENVFCGGNLQGVIEKLDYIKELGFNAIMLSPIFKSANYHGYHTLNFEDVDPHFGTWEDYQQLLDLAHDKGIKIICDFVPNHCWYQAPIFEQSLLKNGGKHRDWFFYPKEDSDEFVSFLGFGDLPKFNLTNPEVASFMIDKAEKLARMGVDAFRIDHALGQPHRFLKDLRDLSKEEAQYHNKDYDFYFDITFLWIDVWGGKKEYIRTVGNSDYSNKIGPKTTDDELDVRKLGMSSQRLANVIPPVYNGVLIELEDGIDEWVE